MVKLPKLSSGSFINKILLFLVLGALCFLLAYFLGWRYTRVVLGNDTPAYYAHLKWVDKYWPRIPYWYDLEGGGVSLVQGYPIASDWLVSGIHHLSSLNLVQAMQLWGWLCLPLTAIGVGFLAYFFIPNWLAACSAGIFFLLSPLSWSYLWQLGFYADVSSYPFVPWAWLFFAMHLRRIREHDSTFYSSLLLLLSIIFYSLVWLMHPLSGLGITPVFFLLFFSSHLKIKQRWAAFCDLLKNRAWRKLFFPWKTPLTLFIFCFLLISWWLIPFFRYNRFANREGLTVGEKSYESLVKQTVSSSTFLSLKEPAEMDKDYPLRNLALPVVVWSLASLGIVLGFFGKGVPRWLCLYLLVGVLSVTQPRIQFWLVNYIPWFLNLFFSRRGIWLCLRILAPVLAAGGLYYLGRALSGLLFYPIRLCRRLFLGTIPNFIGVIVAFAEDYLFTPTVTVLVFIAILLFFGHLPYKEDFFWRVGPEKIDTVSVWADRPNTCAANASDTLCYLGQIVDDIDQADLFSACSLLRSDLVLIGESALPGICSLNLDQHAEARRFVAEFKDQCRKGTFSYPALCSSVRPTLGEQLAFRNWPPFLLGGQEEAFVGKDNLSLLSSLERFAGEGRYDISPGVAELITTSPVFSSTPRIQLYLAQLSPNHAYWGYQASAFFSPGDSLYQNSSITDNLAGYYGINAVAFPSYTQKLLSRYSTSWQNQTFANSGATIMLENTSPTKLVDFDQRRRVLVIASKEERAYEQVFRAANRGLFPYQNYLLYEGDSDFVDDYSLEQLSGFDLVWLNGYRYKNRRAGYYLLEAYARQGGRVFIDTGWQYIASDWQSDGLSAIFPASSLQWSAPAGTSTIKFSDNLTKLLVGKTVSSVGFTYDWDYSFAPISQMSFGFTSLLTAGDKVVMAKADVGEGTVIWSGLNYLAYALGSEENERRDLISYLYFIVNGLYLWSSGDTNTNFDISYQRPDPTKAVFTLQKSTVNTSTFYWKENWYFDWHARLVSPKGSPRDLKIYRAGPGMMGLVLPSLEKGSKIAFTLKLSLVHYCSYLLTLLGFVFLLLYLFKPGVFCLRLPFGRRAKNVAG